jgi:hypothetical protein
VSGRASIWVRTFVVLALYAGAIWLAEWWLFVHVAYRPLALAFAFAVVQVVATLLLTTLLFWRKSVAVRRETLRNSIRAEIHEALAVEAVGQDQFRKLRGLAARSRRDVANELAAAVAALRGGARQRIVSVARELGMAFPATDAERLEAMFATAASGPLLRRAVLTEELESDAARLASHLIPRALTSSDPALAAAALEMLFAWKRALPVPHLSELLRHSDPRLRARAARVLPYAAGADAEMLVMVALRDSDDEVKRAAAEAARQLRIEAAVPLLAEMMAGAEEVAVAAAFAIAAMPDGPQRLQAVVESPDRRAAAIAFEALEKATLGRLEPA